VKIIDTKRFMGVILSRACPELVEGKDRHINSNRHVLLRQSSAQAWPSKTNLDKKKIDYA